MGEREASQEAVATRPEREEGGRRKGELVWEDALGLGMHFALGVHEGC